MYNTEANKRDGNSFFFFFKRRLAGGMVELAKLHQSDYWETLCEGAHNKCFHKVTDV